MNKIKQEIQNYKNEIQFHLREANFWKKKLRKVEKLNAIYQQMEIKDVDVFFKKIKKIKKITKSDVIDFVLRG